ncbi:MAG: Aspartokinase [Chlamydiales bacterium]|nr:Aspartokinase [Chlamydiales bacterium]
MPEEKKTLIMKFGGAAVKTPECFASLASLIKERKEHYPRIVAVVSAMGGMTDHLISLAFQVNASPPKREYDMLVSVGERISISLLAMALEAQGEKAVSFTGSQSGVLTTIDHSDARILAVQPQRLHKHLDQGEVVIVAGFQGVSKEKEITTLGRGGSDTSAVALGVALGAEKVEFYKDVSGIFSEDPVHSAHASVFEALSFEEALEIVKKTGGQVLHPRALLLAQRNHLPLHVRSFHQLEGKGTFISSANPQTVGARYEE